MNDSVYAPPKANLTTRDEGVGDSAFYVVSLRKLTIMFIMTFGMYQVYWTYKNWSRYKERAQYTDGMDRDIWPVPRAIFSVFFIHSLFREVAAHAAAHMRTLSWNLESHATQLVILLVVSGVSGRMSDKNIGSPYSDILWIVLLIPLLFSYRLAQRQINEACGDPEGRSNQEMTAANWIWIAIGAIFIVLIAIGLSLPDEA